jgi:RNA polymerase sigma-70 factor (ECF subfamily)
VNEDEDRTLVQLCRDGDRTAFGRLVGRYQKPVFNAALRLLRDPEDARDVAQTTFLKAFEHLADYDPSFKFYSWIYRIAINQAINVLASRKSSGELTGEEADEAPGPEQRVESEQIDQAIQEALMRINPELRAVVVLRHFMHLSYHDMGDILLLPEKTVKSRLYSARQQLRECFLHNGAP